MEGSPADCIKLALSEFCPQPDLVVSGINGGLNLGINVLYSGTVAAAIEGRFLGLPAMAVSLVIQPNSGLHFTTAARVAAGITKDGC